MSRKRISFSISVSAPERTTCFSEFMFAKLSFIFELFKMFSAVSISQKSAIIPVFSLLSDMSRPRFAAIFTASISEITPVAHKAVISPRL